MANNHNHKCVICGVRPWANSRQDGFCQQCGSCLDAGKRREKKAKTAAKPDYYLVYNGYVVAIRLKRQTAELLRRPAYRTRVFKGQVVEHKLALPQKHTLDLNQWLDGYTRQQIKALKRVVLKIASTSVYGAEQRIKILN